MYRYFDKQKKKKKKKKTVLFASSFILLNYAQSFAQILLEFHTKFAPIMSLEKSLWGKVPLVPSLSHKPTDLPVFFHYSTFQWPHCIKHNNIYLSARVLSLLHCWNCFLKIWWRIMLNKATEDFDRKWMLLGTPSTMMHTVYVHNIGRGPACNIQRTNNVPSTVQK